jgi:hypothetical protein
MKSYKYSELLSRMDEAIEHEFYLEASWISYAIFEDRLLSILKESGGGHDKLRMLGPKLGEVNKRMVDTLNMRKSFYGDLLPNLHRWKDERNTLMHTLASEAKTAFEIDQESKKLALDGRQIARDLCAACRRYKKLNSKVSS